MVGVRCGKQRKQRKNMKAKRAMSVLLISLLTVGSLLLVSPEPGRSESPRGPSLEEVLVESAGTPAQHRALAQYFSDKAQQARHESERHRSMARHYAGSLKENVIRGLREHCNRLADSYAKQAEIYEEMAKSHLEAAGS